MAQLSIIRSARRDAFKAKRRKNYQLSIKIKGVKSVEHYERGNRYRKEGKWHEAINEYIAAIELDPDSPAVEAKKMLDDILNFYNKDAYNP